MKAQFNAMYLLFISALLTGCGIEPALSGKAYEDYVKSIKHYIEWWDKPGMTVEGRRQDWMECGGTSEGDFRPPARKFEEMTRLGVTESIAYTRLESDMQRCIINKGYHYTGSCSGGSMKPLPACGAP